MGWNDPGPCPICGAAHAACTSDSGPVVIVQLPERDATEVERVPLVSELPSEEVSTATYRRAKKG